MTLTQEDLRAGAASRLSGLRPDLAERFDLRSRADLLAAHRDIAELAGDTDSVVAVVLRSFDLAAWVGATCDFAAGVTADAARDWRRALTRTIFLSGNPENLRERFAFDHVGQDGSVAWLGPATARATEPLRRLLRLFDGPMALPPCSVVDVPISSGHEDRPPVRRDLYVATANTTVATTLVALNHLLAEAVLDGLIAPGDRLTLRLVPRLVGAPGPFAALRVEPEPGHADRLTASAGLSEARPPGRA
ncbi:MAG: DUF6182 family protein [Actinoallomurus sp.]